MGAAVAERQAEALARTDRDVGAELARRPEQAEGEQVGGHDHQHPGLVGPGNERRVVEDPAVGGRVLDERADEIAGREVERRVIAHHDLDADRLRPGADHRDRLRMAELGDEEARPLGAAERVAHVHRLGGGGGLVEQRGVGDRQAGEVGDRGLEGEQRLEAPLRDLRLIGRVLRVPAGVLEDVALDHRRQQRAVVPHAEERAGAPVALGEPGEQRRDLPLAGRPAAGRRLEGEGAAEADAGRHRLVDEGVERGDPDRREHRLDLARAGAEVAAGKGVQGCERGIGAAGRAAHLLTPFPWRRTPRRHRRPSGRRGPTPTRTSPSPASRRRGDRR
ncbi:MAG: hypothetical protein BWX64_02281 [Acidobacteria bacterium ADurb.Bin051]|nr:MAG: hypothetical protein BWX64_02281 [Acidobacteria bacterium ADurb.Bin051]